MRRLWLVVTAIFAVLASSTVSPPTVSAANTFLTNPLGFAYKDETNVPLYGHPTGMLPPRR